MENFLILFRLFWQKKAGAPYFFCLFSTAIPTGRRQESKSKEVEMHVDSLAR